MIYISDEQLQKLAKKHFGTELTEIEMESLECMYDVDLDRVDDGGWEGAVAHTIQSLVDAMGIIVGNHRRSRSYYETSK